MTWCEAVPTMNGSAQEINSAEDDETCTQVKGSVHVCALFPALPDTLRE